MTDSPSKIQYQFGTKLREIREKKGYTLKQVAQSAGVSESLVSQIERNKVSPAIDTLLTLASVLDVNLEYLFEEYNRQKPITIIHEGERRELYEDDVRMEELIKTRQQNSEHSMESYMLTIPVGSSTHRGNYGHIGHEFGVILEGKGIMHYESKQYELREGDSVSFAAGSPHMLENSGDIPLKALWVVTPAQRFVK